MRTITTRNSVYEVDMENKRVRRVSGKYDPVNYIGKDGEWRDFDVINEVFDSYAFVNAEGRAFITSSVITDEEAPA